ncbi:hypothetical protein [Fluviicola sp.]|uniref:hypothetical protein n=1 Tax=Fluviicola sp. TaxID=1917219 RepID=UPI002635E491|nr:hypothetical protein [Fluviicola sp.]
MKKLSLIITILIISNGSSFSQSNRIPANYNGSVYQSSNKELLLHGLEQKQKLYDSRVNEVITMLYILSDIYKMKTDKYEDGVPQNLSLYYNQVHQWLVDACKYDLSNSQIWIQVQDFYIKHKNSMMSW